MATKESGTTDVRIYKLVFEGCAGVYVGQTSLPLNMRLIIHRTTVKQGRGSRLLAQAFKQYGNPEIILLQEVDKEHGDTCERAWIKELDAVEPSGLNQTSGGNRGWRKSPELNRRMSEIGKVVQNEPVMKERRRQKHLGMKRSDAARANMSAAKKLYYARKGAEAQS